MKRLAPALVGFVLGILVTAIVMWKAMPGMMLTSHVSRFATVEETCDAIQKVVASNDAGWVSPGTRSMTDSIKKHGVAFTKDVRIVELCNAKYAADILTTNPEVSTLMPCAWGVYEGEDGKIHITGMNMSLMARMFGGNIAAVMGGSVAEDEHEILTEVVVTE